MGLVLLVASTALLALPGLARPWGKRVSPSEWAKLCAVALGGGAVLLELTLLSYAAPTVLRAAGVPLLASLCERMLGPLVPGGPVAGWTAATAAVTLQALAVVGARRAVREWRILRAEPWLGEHHDYDGHKLVVLPTSQLVAVTVPTSSGGQIVVSDGLVDTLEQEALQAVLRHEAAHLDQRHDRYLLLATSLEHAFAFFPPLRRSTSALRATLERWADEDAVRESPAARAVLRRALLEVTTALVAEPSVAAFTTAETLVERIDALDTEPPQPSRFMRGVLYLPGAAVATVAGFALLVWAADVHTVLAMAGTCYA